MDDEEQLDAASYAWEGIYERPWEAVRVGDDGSLQGADSQLRREAREVQVGVKRGVLRSLFLVLDASRQASENDPEMRPSRLAVMVEAASAFVTDFFDQNPISTLAVIATRDGRADLLTELSCNPRQHLQALKTLGEDVGRGEASLQNALELARESLHAVPSFTSREVVMLSASLSTCDPGDIYATAAALKRDKLRTSIFSLLAEVHIYRRIAADTGGEFGVPVSVAHLRELVLALVPPRPTEATGGAAPSNSLIRVGFPQKRARAAGATIAFSPGGGMAAVMADAPYTCPQCEASHTELPTQVHRHRWTCVPAGPAASNSHASARCSAWCPPPPHAPPPLPCLSRSQCQVCNLKLMSSVELTKTYHHLFPVASFAEVTRPEAARVDTRHGADSRQLVPAGMDGESPPQPLPPEPVPVRYTASVESGPVSGLCFSCAERLPRAHMELMAVATSPTVTGFECKGAPNPAHACPAPCRRPFMRVAAPAGLRSAASSPRITGCHHVFCASCDELIHAVLHTCPGCELVAHAPHATVPIAAIGADTMAPAMVLS